MRSTCRLGLLGFVIATASVADESEVRVEVAEQSVIRQQVYQDSANGCGPACILNLLQSGPEEYRQIYQRKLVGSTPEVKIRFLVDRYFKNSNSTVYQNRKKWGLHGIAPEDLAAGLNELLSENNAQETFAQSLDRRAGETDSEFLQRIHRIIAKSLQRGVTPILSLRSYTVKRRERNDSEPGWEVSRHHMVLITSVAKEWKEGSAGFPVTVLDPFDGKSREVLFHAEANGQPFRALKGIETAGNWLSGRPYLLVQAPGLQTIKPRDLEWSERFLITANYLISR